jgi:hypothetical protein
LAKAFFDPQAFPECLCYFSRPFPAFCIGLSLKFRRTEKNRTKITDLD